mmetsp:Transcript_9588/g.35636  ORF Transcript_9588/g.35636 Transcript_9588/m.35636 type:complete len:258 (-) Transcript_9588:474-1247(-)
MCMQPLVFSIGRLHFGHGLVFARIQERFSDSALFLMSHLFTVAHGTGRCASSLHLQQNENPHAHCTSTARAAVPPASAPRSETMARSHPGATHQTALGLSSTKLRQRKVLYFSNTVGSVVFDRNSGTRASGTRRAHVVSGHRRSKHEGPSLMAVSKYPPQHTRQKWCPHPHVVFGVPSKLSKHTRHVVGMPGASFPLLDCVAPLVAGTDDAFFVKSISSTSPTFSRPPASSANHASFTRCTFHLCLRSSAVASGLDI